MKKFYIALALMWLALMPPLFTAGACTDEYKEVTSEFTKDLSALATVDRARAYFQAHSIQITLLNHFECKKYVPRVIRSCGDGPVILVKVPVKNAVCSFYRGSNVKVVYQFDVKNRLQRVITDMDPFTSLPIPFTKIVLHWGR